MLASGNGYSAVVELLLRHPDISINAENENGSTALMVASENGHDAVAELLLSRPDIDFNTQEQEQGRTALMLACRFGYVAIVKLLLSQPTITINTQDENWLDSPHAGFRQWPRCSHRTPSLPARHRCE